MNAIPDKITIFKVARYSILITILAYFFYDKKEEVEKEEEEMKRNKNDDAVKEFVSLPSRRCLLVIHFFRTVLFLIGFTRSRIDPHLKISD